ncbi:MAG: recombinase family protein [bacterium]|nr:recombinase family protein [bacterium]
MKNVYGYIRVSDKKQEDGASLIEQKRIISEYAQSNDLKIIHFYEETKTAAKRGRPFFTEMLQNLKQGKVEGVIMHKIDRSARNLHDWASIGDLIDNNIAVFFAHESLNLNERGGRLSADIQAVMASDYVRNLRQEALKGLYGRLKQGIWPFGAPVGYLNNGKGKLKTVDPVKGKLVKQLFKLYVTENYNIITLAEEMKKRGLTNTHGNYVDKNSIVAILKNPFYIGLMKVKGQIFQGNHKALIDTRTYKQAQLIIGGRNNKKRGVKHSYLFRKLLKCELCNYTLSGERQKGNVYYRCQTKGCATKCIREDTVEQYVKNTLKTISLSDTEIIEMKNALQDRKSDWVEIQEKTIKSCTIQIHKLDSREQKLLDAYLDNIIKKEEYERRKTTLLIEKRQIIEKKEFALSSKDAVFEEIEKFLELCNEPLKLYKSAILEEKRECVKNITSNLIVKGKGVVFTMVSPYSELANRDVFLSSALNQDNHRTMTSKIIYMDKNTSGIQPKSLNKEQTEQFFNILLGNSSILNAPNHKQNNEISKDDSSTE